MKVQNELTREELLRRVERLELRLEVAESATPTQILEPFFNLSMDLLCIAGTDGYFKRVNPAFQTLFGYSERELLDRPFLDFVHPEDRAKTVTEIERLESGLPTVQFVNRYLCQDGSVRWIEWNASPVSNKRAGLIYAVARDVTHRREVEDELKSYARRLERSNEKLRTAQLQLIQAEKMESIGRLAAGVAHEVKNPLAMLQLGLDYCQQSMTAGGKDSHADAEITRTVLSTMQGAITRADSIIRGMLDFSSSKQLDLKPQDVNEIVREALRFARHDSLLANVKLKFNLEPKLPKVAVDRGKILQVILNLITNAVHATPEGGQVAVRTGEGMIEGVERNEGARTASHLRESETVICVEVEDTGKGIPPEDMGRIFDPFYTTKATGQGTGLGLAVCRSIMELHRGMIEIANRDEGGVAVRIALKAKG